MIYVIGDSHTQSFDSKFRTKNNGVNCEVLLNDLFKDLL